MPQRFLDDEEELMGNTSYGVGYTNFVASNTDHWVFDNTGMKNGDTIPDLIGWEYHGYPLKNDPTLVVLSENPIDPNKHADPDQKIMQRLSILLKKEITFSTRALVSGIYPCPHRPGSKIRLMTRGIWVFMKSILLKMTPEFSK